MSRQGRRAWLAVVGAGVIAALALRTPLSATDYKRSYADRFLPVDRPSPHPSPISGEALKELQDLIREDYDSWETEVFRPLAFTNRTCVRMREHFLARLQGRWPTAAEHTELERQVLSVRRGMADRAHTFVARTDQVRELNRLLCVTLDLHVDWAQRVIDIADPSQNPPPPPELVGAKQAFAEKLRFYAR